MRIGSFLSSLTNIFYRTIHETPAEKFSRYCGDMVHEIQSKKTLYPEIEDVYTRYDGLHRSLKLLFADGVRVRFIANRNYPEMIDKTVYNEDESGRRTTLSSSTVFLDEAWVCILSTLQEEHALEPQQAEPV